MSGTSEQDLLDAAEKAVRDQPGITSAEVMHVIPGKLAAAGRPSGVTMSRDRAKALLRTLQQQGRVTTQAGQASVGYYPAEAADAERPE